MTRSALVVGAAMALVRDGLLAMLAPSWPVGAVRSGSTLERCLALAEQVPDCVMVLDAGLLGEGAMGAVRGRLPLAGVIVLRDGAGPGGLRYLESGAHGVLGKADGAAELLRAVAVVRGGGVHVPRRVAEGETLREQARADGRGTAQLTGRQRDVLRLLAEGRSTKDIARSMDLAVSTIKVHLAALYRTVGARNRVEALCRAGLLAG